MLNENDFLGYMSHQEQIERIVAAGVELAFLEGGTAHLEIPDDFTDAEIEYIENRIVEELLNG